MLFSDPTASDLQDPPAVLVQADVESVGELTDDPPRSYEMFKESIERQPQYKKFLANSLTRFMFMFQFQRIAIYMKPHRILSWPKGDFSQPPTEIVVKYVE
jgi:hypothetical protein